MEALLISTNKLRQNSFIDKNIDEKVLNTAIVLAQKTDLAPLIGDSLYKEIIDTGIAGNMSDKLKALKSNFIEDLLTYYVAKHVTKNKMARIANAGVVQSDNAVSLDTYRMLLDTIEELTSSYENDLIEEITTGDYGVTPDAQVAQSRTKTVFDISRTRRQVSSTAVLSDAAEPSDNYNKSQIDALLRDKMDKSGLNVDTIDSFKIKLGLDKVDNTADINKPIPALINTELNNRVSKSEVQNTIDTSDKLVTSNAIKSALDDKLPKGGDSSQNVVLHDIKATSLTINGKDYKDGLLTKSNVQNSLGDNTDLPASQKLVKILSQEVATKAPISHSHNYEAPIGHKNTAFNKDFGTSSNEVAEGDHNHDGRYMTPNANDGIVRSIKEELASDINRLETTAQDAVTRTNTFDSKVDNLDNKIDAAVINAGGVPVENTLTSTSTTNALSAAMGNELYNLKREPKVMRRFTSRNGNQIIDSVGGKNATLLAPVSDFNGIDSTIEFASPRLNRIKFSCIPGVANNNAIVRLTGGAIVYLNDGNYIYLYNPASSIPYIVLYHTALVIGNTYKIELGFDSTNKNKIAIHINDVAQPNILLPEDFDLGTVSLFDKATMKVWEVTVNDTTYIPLPHLGIGFEANTAIPLTNTNVGVDYIEGGSTYLLDKGAVKVQGRNLLGNSKLYTDSGHFNFHSTTISNPSNKYLRVESLETSGTPGLVMSDVIQLAKFPEGEYIVSVDVRAIGGITRMYASDYFIGGHVSSSTPITAEWQRVSIKINTGKSTVKFYFLMNCTALGQGFDIKNVKIEKGSVATPWSPAPEDNTEAWLSNPEQTALRSQASPIYIPNKPNGDNAITLATGDIEIAATTFLNKTPYMVDFGARQDYLDTFPTRNYIYDSELINVGTQVTYHTLIKAGEYTYSTESMVSTASTITYLIRFRDANGKNQDIQMTKSPATKVSKTFTLTSDAVEFTIYPGQWWNATWSATIKKAKLESGAVATDWTPAIEDDEAFEYFNKDNTKVWK